MDDSLANVGVIAHMQRLRAHHPDLAQALGAFLQSQAASGRSTAATLRGQLVAAPIWSGLRGAALYGDHVLCVGEAAALVHPLTAEGISGALTSGHLAAVTALSAPGAGRLLPMGPEPLWRGPSRALRDALRDAVGERAGSLAVAGGGRRRRGDNAALRSILSVMVAPALILAEQQALQSRDKRVGAFLGEGAQDEAVGTDDDEAVPAPAEQARVR